MYYYNLYYCHRQTMVVYASMMNGQFDIAYNMQHKLQDKCKFGLTNFNDYFENGSWLSKLLIKFGKFENVLLLSNDNGNNDLINDIDGYNIVQYYFAKAFSLASMNKCDQSYDIYLNKFLPLCKDKVLREKSVFLEKMGNLFDVAQHYYLGRYYEICKNNITQSINEWELASILNMDLQYFEPPYWPLNPRACQGQVLLNSKKFEQAEKIFQQDLKEFVNNGWGLKGLLIALKAQNKENTNEYKEIMKQFQTTWKYSDTPIDKACF